MPLLDATGDALAIRQRPAKRAASREAGAMIVTLVRFPPRDPVGLDEARDRFGSNAASYLDVPGLLWKAYLRSGDGTVVGGVYWWTDRASAEARFGDGWLAGVTAKYGAPPSIEWFDAPVVVDNRSATVFTEAPRTP